MGYQPPGDPQPNVAPAPGNPVQGLPAQYNPVGIQTINGPQDPNMIQENPDRIASLDD